MIYKLTKSLIEAWSYAYSCYESVAGEAYQDFLRTLRREGEEQTEEMLNGLAFENDVYALCDDPNAVVNEEWENGARLVADEFRGARLQVRLSRPMRCHGMDILVVGVLDGLKAGVIKDCKYSNKSFGSADLQGKYLDCSQHSAYFYITPAAYRFDYVVSDGEDKYIESYTRQNTRPFEDIADEFFRSLEDTGLLEEYKAHWQIKEHNET